MTTLYIAFIISLVFMILLMSRKNAVTSVEADRLQALIYAGDNEDDYAPEIDWSDAAACISRLSDRLGKAGYYSIAERRKARTTMIAIIGGLALAGAAAGMLKSSVLAAALAGVGAYLGLMVWLYYLKQSTKNLERETLFQLPLALESLMLLVESGLGILPALQKVVDAEGKNKDQQLNPVTRVLKLVYDLAAHGMPLGKALELVGEEVDVKALRHVLLHLDISGAEGGALLPSLQSLSEHSHNEWKLGVEERVKKLENLVVFPVFGSVIGLVFLVAAVPLVPMLELRDTLNGGSPIPSAASIQTQASENGVE